MDRSKRQLRLRHFDPGEGVVPPVGFVDFDGVRIAELSSPRFEDMFWCSYAVTPVGDAEAVVGQPFGVRLLEGWDNGRVTFRDYDEEPSPATFPAGRDFIQGRIVLPAA